MCCSRRQTDQPLHWLPDPVPDNTGEHFKTFSELWGTETTEEHRPSLKPFEGKVDEDQQVLTSVK